jgi:hypothetical protein
VATPLTGMRCITSRAAKAELVARTE